MDNTNNHQDEINEILELMDSTNQIIEQGKIENQVEVISQETSSKEKELSQTSNKYNFRDYENDAEYIKYKQEMQLRNPDKIYEEDYSMYEINDIEDDIVEDGIFTKIFWRHKLFWIFIIILLIINLFGKIKGPASIDKSPQQITENYSEEELSEIVLQSDVVQELLDDIPEEEQENFLEELGVSQEYDEWNKSEDVLSEEKEVSENVLPKEEISTNNPIGRGNISIPDTKEVNENKTNQAQTEITSNPNIQKSNIYIINGNNDIQIMLDGEITNISLIGVQDINENLFIKNYISNGQEIFVEFDKNKYISDEVMCCYLWLKDPSSLSKEEYPNYLLNCMMIKEGIVKFKKDSVNNKYEDLFLDAESTAVLYKKGIWG